MLQSPLGAISINELITYIDKWKIGAAAIEQVMDTIGKWKSGL